jgi:hypothetical protein
MARFRKPFFKKSHAAWYVELDGRQVRLGDGREAAFERYHELMADRRKAERFAVPGEPAPMSLGELLDKFLATAFKGRAAATRQWYADKLTPLVNHLGREAVARDVKPLAVDEWVTAHPDWSAGTARNLWRAVQRLYRWGKKKGAVPESPLVEQEKPRGGRREAEAKSRTALNPRLKPVQEVFARGRKGPGSSPRRRSDGAVSGPSSAGPSSPTPTRSS